MFKKILIANRGEIACRIIKTAKKMEIKTVAVFSDSDRYAEHVRLADEAVYLGASPASESYLRVDLIIKACKEKNCDALQPGYGFLSENSSFPESLNKVGITFIGPSKSAIASMGDKIESKKIETRTLEYEKRFANPFIAAERGFLDDVIIPSNSRFRLIQAFSKLKNKTQKNPDKKFGNIPL